jgi:hypothetical protein
MPHSPKRPYLDQSFDVLGYFLSQISLDPPFILDDLADPASLLLGEVLDLGDLFDSRLIENLGCPRTTDPVHIGQSNTNLLVLWQIDSGNSSHGAS